MTLEVHVAELDQRVNTVEKNIDRLRSEHREYTDSRVREACLQMNMNTRETASEFKEEISKAAREVRADLKKDAGTLAKMAEWAFKIGMVFTLGWISVNQAHALTILGS